MRRRRRTEERTAEVTSSGESVPIASEPVADETLEDSASELESLAQQSKLSDHLASVLRAAEDAAAAIREDAQRDAAAIRVRAEKEAESLQDANRQARQEVELHAAQAERVRADAESAGEEIRQRADAYAEAKRQEAEANAGEIIALAEQTAVKRSVELELRDHAIRERVAETEARVRELVGGLLDLASSLEDLAGTEPRAEQEPESLVESLTASLPQEPQQGERPVSEG